MRVIWSPAALGDVGRIYDYIVSFNPNAAERLVRRLIEAGEQLEHFPERGRPALASTREMTIVSPYILVYEVVDDTVNVLRIWHGAQNRT